MSDVRWEGFTHEEIYSRVHQGPGRSASADAEAAWATVESTIRAVDDQLSRAMKQIGVDWQGPAADGVRGGMTVMSNWALDAAGDALLTRDGIAAQADAAAHVRAAMPPPHQQKWEKAAALLSGAGYAHLGANVGAVEDRLAEDRAAAVDLMNRYTSDSSTNQQMMNYWTPPPSVVVETVAPGSTPDPATSGAVAAGLAAAGIAAGRVRSSTPVAGSRTGAPPADAAGGSLPSDRAVPAGSGLPVPGARPPGPGVDSTSRPSSRAERLPGGVRPVVPGPPSRPPTSFPEPSRGPIGAGPGRGGSVVPVPGPRSGSTGGGPVLGGQPEEAAPRRTVVPDAVSERLAPASRAAPASGHGFLPFGGVAARPADQDHRRPGYLIDDADAFADDRWFTPPVIAGDDVEAARG